MKNKMKTSLKYFFGMDLQTRDIYVPLGFVTNTNIDFSFKI